VTQTIEHRLHVLEAADWKAGIITLLEPRSPYRPWRYAFAEARRGDFALLTLGTDPVSVLTVLAEVGDEGALGGALLDLERFRADVVELSTLTMMLDLPDSAFTSWRLDDDHAEAVISALRERRLRGGPYDRCGHSSLAAARNLLRFNKVCHGCHTEIDLTGLDAREQIHVHTVDPYVRPGPQLPIRVGEEDGLRGGGCAMAQKCGDRLAGGDLPPMPRSHA
jgi:hypothetical protein